MRKIALFTILSIGLLCCKTAKTGDQKSMNTEKENQEFTFEETINRFTFDFYAKANKKDENMIFSSFSISSALAMTSMGADHKTLSQMHSVLYLDRQSKEAFSKYIESIKKYSKDDVELNIANAIWMQEQFKIKQSFIDQVKKYFHSEAQSLNFKTKTEESRNIINTWVQKQTNGKIEELLSKGIISDVTRMILTNALYFKAGWMEKFQKEVTTKRVFYAPSEEIEIPFMQKKQRVAYHENRMFQMIELPYIYRHVSMLIFVPRQKDGLKDIEEILNYKFYKQWLAGTEYKSVFIVLPKFKISQSYSLKTILEEMGMTDAFSKDADFSKMTGRKDLKIDQVIHKGFIEVDENGTEAAAATAVAMVEKASIPVKPVSFIADRPFLFLLKDNHSEVILFAGKVVNP